MATKRIRNANNALGAVEILDTGEIQFSDKTDATKKLRMDLSNLPTGTVRNLAAPYTDGMNATLQNAQEKNISGGYYIANNTSVYIPHTTLLEMSVLDFTVLSAVKLPQSNSTQNILLYKENSNAHYGLLLTTGGIPKFDLRNSAGTTQTAQGSTAVAFDGNLHTFVGLRSGVNSKLYQDGMLVGSNAGGSILDVTTGAGNIYMGYTPGNGMIGQSVRNILFNYALSEDKIRRYSAGAKLDYEDIGGNMNLHNTCDASHPYAETNSNTGWTANAYLTASVTSTSGNAQIGTYHLAFSGSGNGARVDYAFSVVAGKRYQITFWSRDAVNVAAYVATTNASDNIGNYPTTHSTFPSDLNATGTYVQSTLTFTADATGTYYFSLRATGATPSAKFDNFQILQLGAIVDLEPENVSGSTWYDASSNALHGIVSNAVLCGVTAQYDSRNYLLNGAFDFWQRGTSHTSATAAGNYGSVDRWRLMSLAQSVGFNVASIAQLTTNLPPQSKYAAKITASATSVDYIAMVQYVESRTALDLVGNYVTLSFKVKRLSNNITPYSYLYAKLAYLSSADTALTDLSSFAGGTVIASIPVCTAVPQLSNSTWTTLTTGPIYIPAGAANGLAALITLGNAGNDISTAAEDLLGIAEVQLNRGSAPAPFSRAAGSISEELALCQRYYEKYYPIDTTPTNTQGYYLGRASSGTGGNIPVISFAVTKRVVPTTIQTYGEAGGSGNAYNPTTGQSPTITPVARIGGFQGTVSNDSSLTPGAVYIYSFGWTADAEI